MTKAELFILLEVEREAVKAAEARRSPIEADPESSDIDRVRAYLEVRAADGRFDGVRDLLRFGDSRDDGVGEPPAAER